MKPDPSRDRELLTLAAKAAGLRLRLDWIGGEPSVPYTPEESAQRNGADGYMWNPLTNDGDALRLAVKLNLTVQFPWDHEQRFIKETHVWTASDEPVRELHDADAAEATRRAIVRAAAVIGKEMP